MHAYLNYKAVLHEEEETLRWMIKRHPKVIELHYYLVFLLVANRRYARALHECARILAVEPGNLIGRTWTLMLRKELRLDKRSRSTHQQSRARESKIWRESCQGMR